MRVSVGVVASRRTGSRTAPSSMSVSVTRPTATVSVCMHERVQ